MDRARADARIELARLTGGDAAPEWRVCYSTEGTHGPTGIAPVCLDEDHDPDDGNVYPCCPEPVIEVQSVPLAGYLAALLNADRGENR
ncbi:hypothetical protein KO717_34575 [Streptomyces xanthophaeus]|nr:hypothetical protein KO717_34575 [Streptomyces xanthophaeus]